MRYSKIIQIIPASGWFVFYKDDTGVVYQVPLAAWGLTEEGSVVPLDASSTGEVENPTECTNFLRIEHELMLEKQNAEIEPFQNNRTSMDLFPEDRIEGFPKDRIRRTKEEQR